MPRKEVIDELDRFSKRKPIQGQRRQNPRMRDHSPEPWTVTATLDIVDAQLRQIALVIEDSIPVQEQLVNAEIMAASPEFRDVVFKLAAERNTTDPAVLRRLADEAEALLRRKRMRP